MVETTSTTPKRRKRQRRATWGRREQLPSGRWRARYVGPDGQTYSAAETFDNKTQADTWLAQRHAEVARDEWQPQARKGDRVMLGDYAETWLGQRQLKPRTREGYRKLLDRQILPTFGTTRVDKLTRRPRSGPGTPSSTRTPPRNVPTPTPC